MRLILIGPPGAGKGTQARWISEHYQLAHISTGDMLRTAVDRGDALGKRVAKTVEAGLLVDDDTIEGVLLARLKELEGSTGFVLDGVPRTLLQAEAVDRASREMGFALDCVVRLDVDDAILVSRFSGRRVHPSSGRTYHIEFNPPKKAGVDDISGEDLIQRIDDDERTVRSRLAVYQRDTEPLLHYYAQRTPLYTVPGNGTVSEVSASIGACLDKHILAHSD